MFKVICACKGVLNAFDAYDYCIMTPQEADFLRRKLRDEKMGGANQNHKHPLYDDAKRLSEKMGMGWCKHLYSGATPEEYMISARFYEWMINHDRYKDEMVAFNRRQIKIVK